MLTCFIGHTFQLQSKYTMMSILHVNMFGVNWYRTNKFQKNSANYLFTGACSSRTIWGKVHNKGQWKFGVLKETYSQNWENVW